MKKILIFLGILLLVVGCAAPRVVYVPTESKTIIEYRDSLIHVKDTIEVEVPREVIREVIPQLETSRLETSVAISEAFIDTLDRKLHHTLRNKETALKGKLDTIVKIEYMDKIVEREVIKEVPTPEPYIPTWIWWVLGYACLCSVISIVKVVLKLKKGGLF
jgi:hypothetical protein